jgi:hypothetical protein
MTRPRAADDFAAIRARMKELRLEREQAALRVRAAAEVKRLDEERWRVSDELREGLFRAGSGGRSRSPLAT